MAGLIPRHIAAAFFFSAFLSGIAFSQSLDFSGQISTWGIINNNDSANASSGCRYIPGLEIEYSASPNTFLSTFISTHAYADTRFTLDKGFDGSEEQTELELHRLWGRISWPTIEIRIGLQKINFGSAVLIRPLMWFDSLDPRDPQQYSKGVYAALLRWYFKHNANIWLWGLYGNNKIKGWEVFPSFDDKAEFGGRIQCPVPSGEIALSFNQRHMDISILSSPFNPLPETDKAERKYAFDTRWDIEIGLWTEFVLVDQDSEVLANRWTRYLNVGADYTLDVGNGFGLICEYFEVGQPKDPFGNSNPQQLYAFSSNYLLGIADEIKGIFYYDRSREEFYRFISWTRTLDNWLFAVNGFWNPVMSTLIYNSNGILSGKGIQLTVTFNH
jgi:hypothetical protein